MKMRRNIHNNNIRTMLYCFINSILSICGHINNLYIIIFR